VNVNLWRLGRAKGTLYPTMEKKQAMYKQGTVGSMDGRRSVRIATSVICIIKPLPGVATDEKYTIFSIVISYYIVLPPSLPKENNTH